MKLYTTLIFIFLWGATLSAQTAESDCNARLAQAKRQLEKDSIAEAINSLLWVKVCDEALSAEANRLILEAFQKIEAHKKEAEMAQKRAEKAEKKARAELEKSKRLSSFFNFGEEEASWAYNSENGLFAVVDKNGKQLTEFIYESPEKFLKGVSLAKTTDINQSGFVFLNTKGQEMSPHFEYISSMFGNKYLVGYENSSAIYTLRADSIYKVRLPARPDGFISSFLSDTLLGLVDTLGHVVVPSEYMGIGLFLEGFAPARKGGKFGVINQKGKLMTPLMFDDLWSFYDGVALAKLDSKYGFIDSVGNWVIPPLYEAGWSFSNGLSQVRVDGLWGFINRSGKMVIPPQYDDCSIFSYGLAPVKKQNKWGFINPNNQTVIDFKYDQASPFINELATVKMGDSSALINRKGEIISVTKNFVYQILGTTFIVTDSAYTEHSDSRFHVQSVAQPGYNAIQAISDSLLLAQKDSLWGLIDINNKIIRSFRYSEIESYGNDYSIIKKQNNFASVDINGIEPYYEEIDIKPTDYLLRFGDLIVNTFSFDYYLSEGILFFNNNEMCDLIPYEYKAKMGFVNKAGRKIISPDYKNVDPFSCGRAVAQNSDLYGYIDKNGNWTLKPVYKYATPFICGKSIVIFDSVRILIDTLGKVLLCSDSTFQLVSPIITNGLILARQNDSLNGFVDISGKWVVPPIYKNLGPFSNGLAVAESDGKIGFIDKSSAWIIPPIYNLDWPLPFFDNGLVIVSLEGRQGVIDTLGHTVIPFQYGEITALFNDTNFVAFYLMPKINGTTDYTHYFVCTDFTYQNTVIGIDRQKNVHTLGAHTLELMKEKMDMDIEENKRWGGLLIFEGQSGHNGILNLNLDTLLPANYSSISLLGYRIYLLKQNGRFGLFAPDYHVFLPCKYEKIGYVDEENGWIRVQQNGKWGWVACEKDKKGRIRVVTKIPCRFDVATPFKNSQARVMQLPYQEVFKINTKGEMLLGR